MNLVESSGSLTPEELGQMQSMSVVLARFAILSLLQYQLIIDSWREKLVSAETEGALCRDDSVEGLRWFIEAYLCSLYMTYVEAYLFT